MPDTSGVMIERIYLNVRLITISIGAAAIHAPNIRGNPPASPAVMIGPMKEKLVPWIQSNFAPTGPIRRHCMNVETPDAKSAIETRKPVVSRSSFKAPANLNDEIWRCELESVPVTREELVPLDALIQGLPLAPPKEPEPVDDDLLVCDETTEIFDVSVANYKDRSVKKLTAPLRAEQREELQKQFLQLYLKAKDRAPLRN